MHQKVIKHIRIATTNENLDKLVKLATKIKDIFLENGSLVQVENYHQQEISKIYGSKHFILNCIPIKRIGKGLPEIYGKIFDEMA